MSTHDLQHLTADELDALLEGPGSPRVTSHLATCPACHAMAALDARVVAAIGALPLLEPAPGFETRIMAHVAVGANVRKAALGATPSQRAVAARRRGVAALLVAGGALAAGFTWAALHPAEALRFASPILRDAGHSLWLTLQSMAASASEHRWFGALRDALATPARAVPAIAVAAGAYAVALTGLRRLMTEPAPHARW